MLGDGVGACYGLSQGQLDGLAMKTSKRFVIEVEREADGRWIAEIPVLPGVHAYGATRKDALATVKALALRVLAERLEHGETTGELEGLLEAA